MQVTSRGCRLWCDARGHGTPVLFIQGVGVAGLGWTPQVDALAPSHACAFFDNRGIGQSDLGTDRITVHLMAEDALAVMDAQGWPSAHVVGHSLGGLIALNLALRARQRVRSLSLLCTFADGAEPTKLNWPMLWIGTRTRIGSLASRRRAFLELLLTPQAHATCDAEKLAAELAPLFGHDIGTQPPVAMKQLMAMKGYNLLPRLHELAGTPSLIVSAKDDLIARPVAGKAMAAAIPGSRYVEVEDAAHGLPLTHVDRTNALLMDHFRAAERNQRA